MNIPVILGQTATGKTEVAVELANTFPIEIISADSRQVYKYLSIGTNKPLGNWEQHNKQKIFVYQKIPYHLVDFLDPQKEYNAGMFIEDTTKLVSEIRARKKIPLIVGGTGFYIKSFADGLTLLPKRDEQIRKQLFDLYKIYGKEYLYKMLYDLDAKRAAEIHPNNINRIIRALEIIKITGKPVSSLIQSLPKTKNNNLLMIGLKISKDNLVKRIVLRTQHMFNSGVIEETKLLLDKGYNETVPALSSVGYNWIIKLLKGEISLETAKENFIKDTLKYAKNQNVWFKKDSRIHWIECDNLTQNQVVEKIKILWKKLL
jgi:tRNA dimethylallyltransferase